MDFIHVICTVSIILSNGYRVVDGLHGIVVKESGDYLVVDFSREFSKKHYDTNLQPMVQRINGNDCNYTSKNE